MGREGESGGGVDKEKRALNAKGIECFSSFVASVSSTSCDESFHTSDRS